MRKLLHLTVIVGLITGVLLIAASSRANAAGSSEEFIGPPSPLGTSARSLAGLPKASGLDAYEPPSGAGSLKTALLYCAVVGAIGWAVVNRFKTRGSSTTDEGISIIARKTLAPRAALLVVQVRGQEMVLAQSGDKLQFLTLLAQPLAGRGVGPELWDLDLTEEERLYFEQRRAL